MNIPAPYFVIAASIIAGGFSFLIAVLSKDQKTSEFRQAWIDNLRTDIAELISSFFVITDTIREMKGRGIPDVEISKHLTGQDDLYCRVEMAEAKIKLRLNPEEHKGLLKAIKGLHDYVGSGKIMDGRAADTLVEKAIRESQIVLKDEWKRVKRGEPVFVITKRVSLIVIIVSLIALGAYSIRYLR